MHFSRVFQYCIRSTATKLRTEKMGLMSHVFYSLKNVHNGINCPDEGARSSIPLPKREIYDNIYKTPEAFHMQSLMPKKLCAKN